MQRTYHIHHAPGQHITFEMRLTIETVYNRNLRLPRKARLSKRELARRFGLPHSTFCDEIRRGTVLSPNTFKDRDIRDYSAEIAQAAIDRGNANKGRPMKMTNAIAKLLRIEMLIIEVLEKPEGAPDLSFRVHQQNVGWKGWTPSGFASGSDAEAMRLEAIQMKLG